MAGASSTERVRVKREIDEAQYEQEDTAAEDHRLCRVKQEVQEQRARDAEDGLVVTESVDITDEPAVARHLPSSWDNLSAAQRHAWFYDWHQQHPGERMCPGCFARWDVKYVLKHLRNGRAQFTCNHMTCTNCWAGYCLTCGMTKGGGRSSGYHIACGRQPTWLRALEDELHLPNDDPRVQRPPPLLQRNSAPAAAHAPAQTGPDTSASQHLETQFEPEPELALEPEAEAEAEAELEAAAEIDVQVLYASEIDPEMDLEVWYGVDQEGSDSQYEPSEADEADHYIFDDGAVLPAGDSDAEEQPDVAFHFRDEMLADEEELAEYNQYAEDHGELSLSTTHIGFHDPFGCGKDLSHWRHSAMSAELKVLEQDARLPLETVFQFGNSNHERFHPYYRGLACMNSHGSFHMGDLILKAEGNYLIKVDSYVGFFWEMMEGIVKIVPNGSRFGSLEPTDDGKVNVDGVRMEPVRDWIRRAPDHPMYSYSGRKPSESEHREMCQTRESFKFGPIDSPSTEFPDGVNEYVDMQDGDIILTYHICTDPSGSGEILLRPTDEAPVKPDSDGE